MKKAAICAILLLLLGNVFAQVRVSLETISTPVNVDLREHYKTHTLVRLDYEDLYQEHLQNDGDINFSLEGFDKHDLDITISPKDMRGAQYVKQVWDGERAERFGKSRVATYQGLINSTPSAKVFFTIDSQFLLANWEVNGERYYIDPLWLTDSEADRDIYILYREANAIMPTDFCGADATANQEILHLHHPDDKKGGPEKAGDCYIVEIAIASDFELYQDLGSNETSVENFMLDNLMNVQTDYDDAFADEIQFEVAATYIATCTNVSCDPWTNNASPFALLDDFTAWGNAGNFGATFDVATLWSGRDFTGTTIGLASVGAICNNNRYNTCERFSSNSALLRVLWSHELGHNFNSLHDASGGFIMSPSVNATSAWSTQSVNTISNYIPTRTCLDNCLTSGPPVAFIEVSHEEACEGSYISFFDDSEGNVTSRSWDFDGGVPATSTDPHPIVFFPNGGSYSVSLSVNNTQGSDFTSFTVDIEQDDNFPKVLYYENFEEGFGAWDVENPDNNIGWGITNVGGNLGGQAAFVNNYDYDAAGQTDALISPFFDLSQQAEVRFSFEYAYARYNNSFKDELIVSLSTDGGSTFPNILFEGDENGSGNFATAPDNQSAFFPNVGSDWCGAGPGCIDLDLSDFDGESDVVIKIENITGFGNNMYIDNVALTASCAPASPPVASFSQDEVIGCAPLSVSFVDQSSGLVEFREWEFPGGSPDFATEPNPIVTYNTPGVYDVSLFVENSAGSDLFVDLEAVTVLGLPTADFTYSNTNNTYSFTSLSSGDIDVYEWDFGDGDSSDEINPIHTFDTPGTYEVTLRVYNDCGSDLFFETIVVEALLAAEFEADLTTGCAPLTVQFTDISLGNPDSWDWSFPGGNPSSSDEENPVVVYNDPGIYDVSLTVTEGGASETIDVMNFISVNTAPVADLIVNTTPGDLTIEIIDLNEGADDIEWDFGDGNLATGAQSSYTYDEPGTYTVIQTLSNECGTVEATQTFTLILPVDPSFTASETSGCTPFSVDFAAAPQEDGNTYSWTFEGGTPATSTAPNPTVVYNDEGVYDVSLTITNAAGPATVDQVGYISVGTGTSAGFAVNSTPGDLTITLNDQSNGANTINWDFGDGNMASGAQNTYTYDEPGSYTITQTVSNECGTDEATQMVLLILPVNPSFTASETSGCTPFSVDFVAATQEEGNTYSWTFEGGSPATSSDPNPSLVYETEGSYDVSLTITNAAGSASTTLTNYISVGSAPVAGFMMSSTPGELTVQLQDQSNGANTINWDFGDGNMTSGAQSTYTYDEPGSYTITQTVSNECGTDEASQTVMLVLPVDPMFTASETNGCIPFSVDFVAAPQEEGNTYSWLFEGGNPATSSDPNPTVVYAAEGDFDVSLTITNAAGPASSTLTDYISVGSAPVAGFMVSSTPGDLTVQLQDQSSGANSISWNFGDGTILTGEQTSYTYDEPGTYTITQTVGNQCGQTETSQSVTIILPVEPSFTTSETNGCKPLSVDFVAAPQEEGNTYNWTFEGGTPASSTDPNPTVDYNEAGIFDVSLTITNAAGPATITQTELISVGLGPEAGFTVNSTPGSLTISLEDESNGASMISWNFGDGMTATGTQTTYTYDEPGTYTITQTVSNACGQDQFTQTISLVLPVDPTFTASVTDGCAPYSVDFVASPQEEGNTYSWTFEGGTPATSSEANPTVVYNTAGVFDVSLTISNAAGPASIVRTDLISVGTEPIAGFTAMTTLGEGMVSFIDNSEGAATYSWDFGDNTMSMMPNPTHTYSEAGTYDIVLTVTNACGSDTFTETITIVFPPVATFTQTSLIGCVPHSITFSADDQSEGNTYNWTFEGGTPANSTDPMPTVSYAVAGTYNVSLTVTNAAGVVTEEREDYVGIRTVPEPGFELNTTLGSLTIDVDGPMENGTNEWVWDFGDGTEYTATSVVHTYETSGTYTVTLMATNACGTTTSQQTVGVLTAPEATFTASSLQVCPGEMITLMADEEGDDLTYDWSTPDGMPATANTRMHNVSFDSPGNYLIALSVGNAAGTSSTQQMVVVQDLPTADFEYSVNGLTVTLANNSINASSYNWSYEGGSSSDPEPVITFDGVGTYEITLVAINDCGESTFTQQVSIQGSIPSVSFTASNNEGCGPLSVDFSSVIENADSFNWTFQGGEPAVSTDPNPVVVYDTPGTYPVTLTATNVFGGNSVTQDALITVFELVTADFDYSLTETTASFSTPVNGESSILWTFPDGSTSAMDTPVYTFPENGSYTVSLEAIGPCNTATLEQTIIIDGPLPEVAILNETTKGCAPLTTTFTDNSAQGPTAWLWEFPGGTPAMSSEAIAEVTYPEPGLYSVSLTVTNVYGTTTQEWTDYVDVIDAPASPEFSEATFDNISYIFEVIAANPDWSYSWDLGDDTMAEGTIAEHTYTENGMYPVSLTVTNDCGTSTTTKEVSVVITNVDTPVWVNKLWLSPNPTNGELYLNAEGWLKGGELTVYLTNTLGQRLQQHSWLTNSGNWQHLIDLSNLPAGTYWMQLQWGSDQWTQKILKF